AQQIYSNAQAHGAMPAVAQTTDTNSFETRIGTVPAHAKATVDLTYSEILTYKNGRIFYTLPLNVQKVQNKSLDLVTVQITIKDQKDIIEVVSPSHGAKASKIDDHTWKMVYEKNSHLPDSDFSLEYEVKAQQMGFNFLSTRPAAGEDGYFMMLMAPQEIISAKDVAARDIVFVMDVSGSMDGYKLEQTKSAFNFFVSQLNGDDRFNVTVFSDNVKRFSEEMVSATQANREKAREFIANVQAMGGTNIHEAITDARRLFYGNRGNQTKAIVFLTDGQPTVGMTDVDQIAGSIKAGNDLGLRLFVLGVGEDVSTRLLDKLSLENRGETIYVRQNENIEGKLTAFYETISKPLLVDVTVDWNGKTVSEIYPKTLPNLYKGSQLVLTGRYSTSGASRLMVRGDLNGKKMEFPLEVNFADKGSSNGFVARVWAKSKADALIQEMNAYGENSGMKAEVIRLSKTFQFTTPFTSFISVAPQQVVAAPSAHNQFRTSWNQPQVTPYSAPAPAAQPYVPPAPVVTGPPQTVTVVRKTEAKEVKMWGQYSFFPLAPLLVPNFRKAREQARWKACYANQRVLLGAIEMYNMDHSVQLSAYNPSVEPVLVNGQYLKTPLTKPETGCGYYGVSLNTASGAIACAMHGGVEADNMVTIDPKTQQVCPVVVQYQDVKDWKVDLWNFLAPLVEILINVPIALLGLWFTWVCFRTFVLSPLMFILGFTSPSNS
ncbi:MAG TPA: VWA domain-containing protein, partial [Candidatus Ozemobacteraceae bacterium]|nr:VWA domain-containing protein [Candidatus Ozemobacteraceae bacterium]